MSETGPVLYLGDLDRSGTDIEANTRRVLEREAARELDWRRLGMTEAQAEEIEPIWKVDGRDGRGHWAWEVEALGQAGVVELVRDGARELLPEPLADVQEREERQRGGDRPGSRSTQRQDDRVTQRVHPPARRETLRHAGLSEQSELTAEQIGRADSIPLKMATRRWWTYILHGEPQPNQRPAIPDDPLAEEIRSDWRPGQTDAEPCEQPNAGDEPSAPGRSVAASAAAGRRSRPRPTRGRSSSTRSTASLTTTGTGRPNPLPRTLCV